MKVVNVLIVNKYDKVIETFYNAIMFHHRLVGHSICSLYPLLVLSIPKYHKFTMLRNTSLLRI